MRGIGLGEGAGNWGGVQKNNFLVFLTGFWDNVFESNGRIRRLT